MYESGSCERGQKCCRAHSEVEYEKWKMKYKERKQVLETRGESSQYTGILINLALPILFIASAWKTKVEDAVQKAVLHEHTKDRLEDIYRECTEISKNHGVWKGYVVMTAADALIQHEVEQKERTATGSSTPQQPQHYHIPSKEKTQYQLIETALQAQIAKRLSTILNKMNFDS